MKFTIEVVPVTEAVLKIPVLTSIESVPVVHSIDFVPEQETVIHRQPVKDADHGDAVNNWAWGDGDLIGFGDGDTIELGSNPVIENPRVWGINAATTGITSPLILCATATPGNRPPSGPDVTTSINKPTGGTTVDDRPVYKDILLTHLDADGTPRYTSVYYPSGISSNSKRPLVVWFHGGTGSADDIYDHTSLRTKAIDTNLSGDAGRLGFVLVSVQGRNLQFPTSAPRDGSHHDFYYRDLNSPSTNPDVKNADKIIDDLVATNLIDTDQIYVMGWSNGGHFAQLYAIARHTTTTPNGNNVASAAVYSAGDPFHNISSPNGAPYVPSAQLTTYPSSTVPLALVSRSCDLVACNDAQAADFAANGNYTEPGLIAGTWVTDHDAKVGGTMTHLLINGLGGAAGGCSGTCAYNTGVINHARWPDGVADGGTDWEPSMLLFLRNHTL